MPYAAFDNMLPVFVVESFIDMPLPLPRPPLPCERKRQENNKLSKKQNDEANKRNTTSTHTHACINKEMKQANKQAPRILRIVFLVVMVLVAEPIVLNDFIMIP